MVKFYCSLSLVQWMSGKSILSQGSALSPYPNTGARWKFCASWSPYGFLYVHGDACCSLLIVLFHTWDSWCGVSLCWELSLVSMLHSLEVHPPKNWLSRNWKALKEDSIVLSPVCVISSHKSLASRILFGPYSWWEQGETPQMAVYPGLFLRTLSITRAESCFMTKLVNVTDFSQS